MNSHTSFVAVVQTGSFSAAAKKLHKTPSAISKQIAQLEHRLGVQLFDRTTRALKITEAGNIYYERSRDIARRIEDTENELKEFSGEPRGLIRMTWANLVSSSRITPFLAKFTQQYPGILFDINVSIERQDLVENKFDFAFRQGPLDDSSLIGFHLFDIEPIFCASPEFMQNHRRPDTLQALFELPLLVPNNVDLPNYFKRFAPDLKVNQFQRLHSGNDIMTFLALAKQGFSASFCFKHMVEKELEQGTLLDISPPMPNVNLAIYLVYQNYQYMPAKLRVFIDAIKAEFCA